MLIQPEVLIHPSDDWFNEKEAARRLCCSVAFLRKCRRLGQGPPYFKGGRSVRYSEADLQAYIKSCRREAA